MTPSAQTWRCRLRARSEPFGAWVRLDEPPALVAVDRHVARRLRVLPDDAWTPARLPSRARPLEVHLAVTARCPLGCPGCYVDARAHGEHPTTAELRERLDAIDAAAAFTVAFGGGEPLLRTDLLELAEHSRSRGLLPVLTTSGAGLTAARIAELRAFAQVNVSYDGGDDAMRHTRGTDASFAERAIELLAAGGGRVGVNVLLTRETFPRLDATLRRAATLGAAEAQLLRYKPAGRAAGLSYLARRLSNDQIAGLPNVLRRLSREAVLPLRIDCALLPLIVDDEVSPDDLSTWGVLGCEAGRSLAVVRADGTVAGCSFASDGVAGPYGVAALSQEPLARFSAHADALPEPCATCPFRVSCRGGCRVVADHAGERGQPDPECPRVVRYRASREG